MAAGLESILFSGAISATTDNRHRGISHSNANPSISGNLRLDHQSGFYASMDASYVDFKNLDDDAHIATGFHAGFKGIYQNTIDYDARISYNVFPGSDNDDLDYWEFALTGGYDFQAFYGSLTWGLSPNYINDSGVTLYYAGDIYVPLRFPNGLDMAANAHLGFLHVGDEGPYVDDYVMDYKIGLQYNLPQYDAHINLDYIGTNLKKSECRERCDGRAVLSATKSFGL